MTASHHRMFASRRSRGLRLRIGVGLAIAWMCLVVSLDIQHGLVPKTTLGGLKILIAAALVFAAIRYAGVLAGRARRRLSAGRTR